MQDSEVLIKAFKEHERRDGEKEGFAHTPADALAFKFYRDVSPYLQQHNQLQFCLIMLSPFCEQRDQEHTCMSCRL